MKKKPNSVRDLLEGPLIAINLGIKTFAESLKEQKVEVVQVEWAPRAGGRKDLSDLLDKLM